jgi:hypothetical protein
MHAVINTQQDVFLEDVGKTMQLIFLMPLDFLYLTFSGKRNKEIGNRQETNKKVSVLYILEPLQCHLSIINPT